MMTFPRGTSIRSDVVVRRERARAISASGPEIPGPSRPLKARPEVSEKVRCSPEERTKKKKKK